MTAPDKAFEEWVRAWDLLGYRGAFQDCWLASRKAALEEAANTANMVGAIGNPSSEGTQRVDIMAKQISLAILALGDK